ncbi:MAG: translation initiation factor IF-3 [Armatimonadota bacterium]|nr:translation initiation factor IF-3 [Armatimonadota bacterium]MDW8291075.1 translation initiation factor IF-3 [Armatimonadota bacterium]
MRTDLRINERIRAREVRVVDENGVQVGILPLREALQLAQERGLDLIEVAPQADPPVCRIMDYGKFKYQQAKREKEAQKRQHVVEVKSIRVRPGTDDHDLDFKLNNCIKFLKEGDKVKITVLFRSREITRPEMGQRVMEFFANGVSDIAVVEKPPTLEGRTMTMVLAPKPKGK